jgi:hypothetical protein
MTATVATVRDGKIISRNTPNDREGRDGSDGCDGRSGGITCALARMCVCACNIYKSTVATVATVTASYENRLIPRKQRTVAYRRNRRPMGGAA